MCWCECGWVGGRCASVYVPVCMCVGYICRYVCISVCSLCASMYAQVKCVCRLCAGMYRCKCVFGYVPVCLYWCV